jgi:hypothetical protein
MDVRLVGVLLTNIATNDAAADLVLLEVSRSTAVAGALSSLNGEPLAADNNCVIKVLSFSNVKFTYEKELSEDDETAKVGLNRKGRNEPTTKEGTLLQSIPVCPVCISRIDPIRLGLPQPSSTQICSKYCPSPSIMGGFWDDADSLFSSPSTLSSFREGMCQQQRFLQKWPPPARCRACEVIDIYWGRDAMNHHHNHSNNHRNSGGASSLHHHIDGTRDLFCGECSMMKTLWVWYVYCFLNLKRLSGRLFLSCGCL